MRQRALSAEHAEAAVESVITYAKELGFQYIVCASPSLEDPSRVKLAPKDPGYREA